MKFKLFRPISQFRLDTCSKRKTKEYKGCHYTPEYTGIYKNTQECTRINNNLQEYTLIYKNTQKCTIIHNILQ